MTRIPTSALLLGLAGLIPFLWGGATAFVPFLANWSVDLLGARFTGQPLLQGYGIVILAFMSGVIWGFAAKAEGALSIVGYILSVIPALWAFFLGFGPLPMALWSLLAGFAALLVVDLVFARAGVAPEWWMALRSLLTGIVCLCLAIGAL